jgi:hypothetical protein
VLASLCTVNVTGDHRFGTVALNFPPRTVTGAENDEVARRDPKVPSRHFLGTIAWHGPVRYDYDVVARKPVSRFNISALSRVTRFHNLIVCVCFTPTIKRAIRARHSPLFASTTIYHSIFLAP